MRETICASWVFAADARNMRHRAVAQRNIQEVCAVWFRNLTIAAFLLLAAHQAGAQEDYPADGKIGVKYGPWEIRPENGCSVARNVIDADNWRWYSFWVEPFVVEVMAARGQMVGGTLTVEGGVTEKFTCFSHERCAVDRTELNDGLRSGRYAVLELELTEGRKAGPFNVPLEHLFALLFMGCGSQGRDGPAPPKSPRLKREYLNPEPEVNPQPRR